MAGSVVFLGVDALKKTTSSSEEELCCMIVTVCAGGGGEGVRGLEDPLEACSWQETPTCDRPCPSDPVQGVRLCVDSSPLGVGVSGCRSRDVSESDCGSIENACSSTHSIDPPACAARLHSNKKKLLFVVCLCSVVLL